MNQLGEFPLISIVVFLPFIGSIIIAIIPSKYEIFHKQIAVIFSGISFIASIFLFIFFNFNSSMLQFVEKHEWITSLNIYYYVGVDGISLLLVILTTFLSVIAVFASFNDIKKYVRGYYASIL